MEEKKKGNGKAIIIVILIALLLVVFGVCVKLIVDSSFDVKEDSDKGGSSESLPLEGEKAGQALYDDIVSKIASVHLTEELRDGELTEDIKKSLAIRLMEKNGYFESQSEEEISRSVFEQYYGNIFGTENYKDGSFENMNSCDECPKNYSYDEINEVYTYVSTDCECVGTVDEVYYEETEVNDDTLSVMVRVSYQGEGTTNLYIVDENGEEVKVARNDKEEWLLQEYVFEKDGDSYILKEILVD